MNEGILLLVVAWFLLAAAARGATLSAPIRDPAKLTPRAQAALSAWMPEAVERAGRDGYTVDLTETLRTRARQAELFAVGRTQAPDGSWVKVGATVTNAPPGSSNHETGDAWDFVLRLKGTAIWRGKGDRVADLLYVELGEIGEAQGLRWGGRFTPLEDDGIGWDPYHLEVTKWVA